MLRMMMRIIHVLSPLSPTIGLGFCTMAHAGHSPPQSTSVSLPFLIPSLQVGM